MVGYFIEKKDAKGLSNRVAASRILRRASPALERVTRYEGTYSPISLFSMINSNQLIYPKAKERTDFQPILSFH